MTSQSDTTANRLDSRLRRLLPLGLFLFGFTLFASTLAPSIVFGDPTEYTLVPHLWGILHPPGYAFMTLLVKAWQTLVPLSSLAYRTNLLSATAAALGGVMVYLAPLPSPERSSGEGRGVGVRGEGLLAALCLYAASNYWQHAIHTNAHIITATLASVSLFLLLRWHASGNDKWLYGFGFVAGISVTQHPLLVFGFPAYTIFILWELIRPTGSPRPRRSFMLILKLAFFGLLGLIPWLYFPIRSAIQPPPVFGPSDMNTLDGFLNLVLARGLTNVNLFHFGLAEQWHRIVVFWSLIQLQYAWPLVLLAGLGLIWLLRHSPRVGVLLGLHVFVNLLFTLNTVQDVMAYLLVPIVSIAILIGAGAQALVSYFLHFQKLPEFLRRYSYLALFLFPLFNLIWLYPRISLQGLHDADDYVGSVVSHFEGRGQHAVLLSDWEHATALWYWQSVNGLQLDPADVSVVYVNKPFVDAVWENIDRGPIYLLEYNPAVVSTGFRLRAEGPFYRLEPPPAPTVPQIAHPLNLQYGPVELLGYDLLANTIRPGDTVPVLLYLRAPQVTDQIIQPFARLGSLEYRFTTDSHLLSPYWQAGEVIVERWEVTLPLDMQPGTYPLEVGFSNLTTGEDFAEVASLGDVNVIASVAIVEQPNSLAANFGQRVGVDKAEAWTGLGFQRQTAPWNESLAAKPGETIELRIQWHALAPLQDSYTVFVHLLTLDNVVVESKDYTPLGGAWPTMLWFPKWLPGQQAIDPYTIRAPDEPGEYYIEIGLYGLRSVVRVPAFDSDGNLAGDRFVLGGVTVAP